MKSKAAPKPNLKKRSGKNKGSPSRLLLIIKIYEQVIYRSKRNETIHDRPVLQAAHKAYQESNGSMKALITSLVTSDAFLYRK